MCHIQHTDHPRLPQQADAEMQKGPDSALRHLPGPLVLLGCCLRKSSTPTHTIKNGFTVTSIQVVSVKSIYLRHVNYM